MGLNAKGSSALLGGILATGLGIVTGFLPGINNPLLGISIGWTTGQLLGGRIFHDETVVEPDIKDSDTYGWSPTEANGGEVIPIVYGTHRIQTKLINNVMDYVNDIAYFSNTENWVDKIGDEQYIDDWYYTFKVDVENLPSYFFQSPNGTKTYFMNIYGFGKFKPNKNVEYFLSSYHSGNNHYVSSQEGGFFAYNNITVGFYSQPNKPYPYNIGFTDNVERPYVIIYKNINVQYCNHFDIRILYGKDYDSYHFGDIATPIAVSFAYSTDGNIKNILSSKYIPSASVSDMNDLIPMATFNINPSDCTVTMNESMLWQRMDKTFTLENKEPEYVTLKLAIMIIFDSNNIVSDIKTNQTFENVRLGNLRDFIETSIHVYLTKVDTYQLEYDKENQYLYAIYGVCEGLVKNIYKHKANDIYLTSYSKALIEQRMGSNVQTPISDPTGQIDSQFNMTQRYNAVGLEVRKDSPDPFVYDMDGEADTVKVHLEFSSGLYKTNDTEGSPCPDPNDPNIGSCKSNVKIRIMYRLYGSSQWYLFDRCLDRQDHYILIEKNITESFSISFTQNLPRIKATNLDSIDVQQPTVYQIEIQRYTDDHDPDVMYDGWYYTDAFQLKGVSEVQSLDFAYPNTALTGLKIKASRQLSDNIPDINAVVDGIICRVPICRLDNGAEIHFDDTYWDPYTEQWYQMNQALDHKV
jgi:hypothetical protein